MKITKKEREKERKKERKKERIQRDDNYEEKKKKEYWLVAWDLWHINLCWLFNAKSILIQLISSISNNLVKPVYTV